MRLTFDDPQRDRLAEAITVAERKTRGEIVVVVTRHCDDYHWVPLLWASVAALALPPLVYWFQWWTPVKIYLAQLALFAALLLVLSYWPIRMAIATPALKRKYARRLAREQFVSHGLHTTKGRTGILIFVAIAERYCEVVADVAVAAKVPQAEWDAMVADLVSAFAR